MTDANRADAQTELKKVISEAFAAQALWTTDWAAVQLQSLQPKPPPVLNSLKRKTTEHPTSSKKAKKAQKHLQNMGAYGYPTTTTTASSAFDPNDQAALERRAARFAVEPERKKTLQVSGGSGISNGAGPSLPKANLHRGHLFESKSLLSRSASPYGLDAAAADDPEADPVRGTPHGRVLSHA